MSARILAGVLAPLGVILGPHLLALLAGAAIVLAVTCLAFAIASVIAETGWGVVPAARRAAPT